MNNHWVEKLVMSLNENNTQSNINEASSHSGARYWGNVEVIEEGDTYRISRVEIKPRHGIKPQIHYHRNEHWVVVSGVAKVTCGEDEVLLNRNQSTYVPAATLHKVENPGHIPLVILEIQNGEYLGEDDTERPYDLNLVKPVGENE
ncbi:MAG: phosphomannose isomerase type II C-terminal cupin domain [Nostoc sp. ChiSLP02]|nr:phosphomannose isomerase type II C-terminal cupin domain [Nostoc sp. DedSLP05]MDZ8103090.1 phosphomannose isomerase type II C-terminal cupin domain [Nostoc sp. DedSLP01]MDZ8183353.1 phosphomannose isomerase type II C-terminal cupin domain [Nostoc sp. ChiSLP02]